MILQLVFSPRLTKFSRRLQFSHSLAETRDVSGNIWWRVAAKPCFKNETLGDVCDPPLKQTVWSKQEKNRKLSSGFSSSAAATFAGLVGLISPDNGWKSRAKIHEIWSLKVISGRILCDYHIKTHTHKKNDNKT